MRTNDHAACRLFSGKAGTHRKSATKALCGRHDVWNNAVLFIGIKRARTCYTALNLIEDQHDPVFIGQGPKALHKGV